MYRWTAYNAVYPNGRITETFLGCVWMNIEVQAAAMRRCNSNLTSCQPQGQGERGRGLHVF